MKRFTNRLSPATAIACIALFVSLGGVSYGVATGSIDSREIKNNTIRSKDIRNSQVYSRDIRNSQVYTQDIRNSTVRGGDVRNDSLTGADILESSLGKVPSAANADTLGGQGAGAFESNNETIPFAVQQVGDGDKTIANVGPFRLFLRCDANDGGTSETASLVLVSSEEYPAFDDNNGPENEPVPAGQEQVLNSSSDDGPNIDAEGDQGPYAIANVAGPNGLGLWVRSYALGQGLYTADSCYAQGAIETAQLG